MLKRGIAEMNIRQVSLSLSLVAPRAPSMDQGNGLLEPDRYATGIIIVFYADEAAQCSLSLSLFFWLPVGLLLHSSPLEELQLWRTKETR